MAASRIPGSDAGPACDGAWGPRDAQVAPRAFAARTPGAFSSNWLLFETALSLACSPRPSRPVRRSCRHLHKGFAPQPRQHARGCRSFLRRGSKCSAEARYLKLRVRDARVVCSLALTWLRHEALCRCRHLAPDGARRPWASARLSAPANLLAVDPCGRSRSERVGATRASRGRGRHQHPIAQKTHDGGPARSAVRHRNRDS